MYTIKTSHTILMDIVFEIVLTVQGVLGDAPPATRLFFLFPPHKTHEIRRTEPTQWQPSRPPPGDCSHGCHGRPAANARAKTLTDLP